MKFAKRRAAKASIIVGLSVVMIAATAFFCISYRSHRTAAIIAQWRPSVVMVTCRFLKGELVDVRTESGVLMRDERGGYFVLTNFDAYEDGDRLAIGCTVSDDGSLSVAVTPDHFATTTTSMSGALQLPQTAGDLSARVLPAALCRDAAVGDRVVILGYPSVEEAPRIALKYQVGEIKSCGSVEVISGYDLNAIIDITLRDVATVRIAKMADHAGRTGIKVGKTQHPLARITDRVVRDEVEKDTLAKRSEFAYAAAQVRERVIGKDNIVVIPVHIHPDGGVVRAGDDVCTPTPETRLPYFR